MLRSFLKALLRSGMLAASRKLISRSNDRTKPDVNRTPTGPNRTPKRGPLFPLFKALTRKPDINRTPTGLIRAQPPLHPNKRPTSQDTVPTQLKPGEAVLNQQQQSKLGSITGIKPERLFKSAGVPGFTGGGKVTGGGKSFWGAKNTPHPGQPRTQGFFMGGLVAGAGRLASGMIGRSKVARFRGSKSATSIPRRNIGREMIAGMSGGRPAVANERNMQHEAIARAKITESMEKERLARRSLVGKTSLFVIALGVLVPLFKRWTESLAESRREMAIFNGAIASSFAQLDVQRFQLGVQKSRATQGSTTGLIKAIRDFNSAFAPMSADLLTVANSVATVVVKIGEYAALGYQGFKEWMPKLGEILNALEKKDEIPENHIDLFMKGIISRQYEEQLEEDARKPLNPL